MRDAKRIAETLGAVRTYWEANPDLRLSQIIGNAATRAGIQGAGVYNLEDDVLVAFLSSPKLSE